jgi:repressor LexA
MTTTIDLPPLTNRQRAVYTFVAEHCHDRGYSPTIRDICRAFNIASPNGGKIHVAALSRKGWLQWEPGLGRTIRPTQAALEATDGSHE